MTTSEGRYLDFLRATTFSPKQGPELVRLIQDHPDWLNALPPVSTDGKKEERIISVDELGAVSISPVMLASCPQVAYILLSHGADPNKEVKAFSVQPSKWGGLELLSTIHSLIYCVNRQPWKLPLLFAFNVSVKGVLPFTEELTENLLTLTYLLQRGVVFELDYLMETLDYDLTSYWCWKSILNEDSGIIEHIEDIESMDPLILKLFLCYGLNADKVDISPRASGALRPVMYRAIVQSILDYRRKAESLEGEELRSSLLQQPYEILQDLELHGLNPYWDDDTFWTEKAKRDMPDTKTTIGRWRYLQWYTMVKIGKYHTGSYEEGLGAALCIALTPKSSEFSIQVLGVELGLGGKGIGRTKSKDLLIQLFGIYSDDLDESLDMLKESPDLWFLGYTDQERMATRGYTLEIGEVVVQFNTPDFLYGVLEGLDVIGLKREEALGSLTKWIFD